MIDYKWNELREQLDKLMQLYSIPKFLEDNEYNWKDFGNDIISIIRKHFEGEK